ncbi:MAG TPA: hypothetical protein VFQ84_10195 [Arenimonas sp.]|uniref:hypothetical protein n=1 Tax=Arenimonas sp. TaxID=1872635 RepID=UPI002D7EEA1A|nr:hypothetical protein [Arenimonas sp.]HEU0153702.1 hypothetical protein [Arenimonas sp.]
MPLLRTLAHLLLVLALLAGGLAPGAAAADDSAGTGKAMAESCHDLAGDAGDSRDAPPADCCDGGCICDCLHLMKASLVTPVRLRPLPRRDADQRPVLVALMSAPEAPDVRPPIA